MREIPHLKVSSMADGRVNDLHWATILSFCVYDDWCPVFSGRGASRSTGGGWTSLQSGVRDAWEH